MVGYDMNKLVVVDVAKMKIRKEHEFERSRSVTFATCDDQVLLVIYSGTSNIYLLDPETLKQKQRKNVGGIVWFAQPLGNKKVKLWLRDPSGRSSSRVIDMTTLKKSRHPEELSVYTPSDPTRLIWRATRDHAFNDQFVYEIKTGKVVSLRRQIGALEMVPLQNNSGSRNRVQLPTNGHSMPRDLLGQCWGCRLTAGYSGNALRDMSNNQIATTKCSEICSEFPLLVGFDDERFDKNGRVERDKKPTGFVHFANPADGKLISKTKIYEIEKPKNDYLRSRNGMYYRERLDVHGKNVFVFDDNNRFYKMTIPDSVIAKAKSGFFMKQPDLTSVDLTKKTQYTFQSVGAKTPKYRMKYDVPGVKIDSTTGVLTIDGPSIWKKILEEKTSTKRHFGVRIRDRSPISSDSILTMIGVPDEKACFNIPIHVSTDNGESTQDAKVFYVVGYGPKAELDEVIAKREAKMREEREKRMAEQLKQMDEQAKNKAKGVEQRVEELEKDVEKLEALFEKVEERIKAMLEKLDKNDK